MSASYKIYAILPKPSERALLIKSVHQLLVQEGAHIDNDCFLYAAESAELDIDPINSEDTDDPVAEMVNNRNLGSMDYSISDHMINVAYKYFSANNIDAVKISIPDAKVEGQGMKFYSVMAEKLHSLVSARRTILGWDPERQGFDWQEEVKRVRAGVFGGQYEVDLRESIP